METRLDEVKPHPLQKGFHQPLEHPHIFVDSCVQIWPDADFARLNAYGCTAYCITTFRPDDTPGNALDAIADWWRVAREYDQVTIALTAADIRAAKAAGKAAIVIASQGGDFLGQNIHRLDMFQRMGLRMMIPAYNARSPLGDGCWETANAGLSRLGERWVDACNRLGVLIDLTHVGERTSLDVLARTATPEVFSHSNPKTLVDSPRNVTDEQIKRCAETGGVVSVTNWGPLNFRAGATGRPTLDHYLDAIQYVVDLVGGDHVGIGTDMSVGTYPDGDLIRGRTKASANDYAGIVESSPRSRLRYVEGFDDYGKLLNVVDGLEKRGWAMGDIEKVLGGNLLRVFADVWGG